ncbi:MAG TPA: CPBP family intramembrane glutamic endopeptidase, partial [Halobacteriales archaeon]|nr:CPBP family intramembrane glutamic endopeptidase [Halobacteriales archaeon]
MSAAAITSNRVRRVLGFFVLTYAISWTLWIAGAALGTDAATWPVLSTLAGFGPLLAGGFLSWREGRLRPWARQAVRWRVGLRWWAVALLVAPILSLLGYGLYVVATGASFGLVEGAIPVTYLVVFAYVLLLRGGFGEEMGWRGYALPHLVERYTTTVAALLVGVAWAGWHLPLFFVQGTRQGGSFGLYLVSVVGLSVV